MKDIYGTKTLIIGSGLGAIIITMLISSFQSLNEYAFDHALYYFFYAFISCIIYLKWFDRGAEFDTVVKAHIKPRSILLFMVALTAGYFFQKIPDIDLKTSIFGNHRSPVTHSLLFVWGAWLFLKSKKDVSHFLRAIYLSLTVGITIHLLVDSAYLFIMSFTPVLMGHSGHGHIPGIGSALEIPYLLFMTLTGVTYSIHLLKGGIRGDLKLNMWKSLLLIRAPLLKVEKYFYSAIAVLLIANIFTPGSKDYTHEATWTFLIGLGLLIMVYIPRKSKEQDVPAGAEKEKEE